MRYLYNLFINTFIMSSIDMFFSNASTLSPIQEEMLIGMSPIQGEIQEEIHTGLSRIWEDSVLGLSPIEEEPFLQAESFCEDSFLHAESFCEDSFNVYDLILLETLHTMSKESVPFTGKYCCEMRKRFEKDIYNYSESLSNCVSNEERQHVISQFVDGAILNLKKDRIFENVFQQEYLKYIVNNNSGDYDDNYDDDYDDFYDRD